MKMREATILKHESIERYLGKLCRAHPTEPAELLSLRLLSTPVLFESEHGGRKFRVSISHQKETQCRETLRDFLQEWLS